MPSRDPRFGLTDFHDATSFSLAGAHRSLERGTCHGGTPPFDHQLAPIEGIGCHWDERLSAQPDHLAAAFGLDCEGCHSSDD